MLIKGFRKQAGRRRTKTRRGFQNKKGRMGRVLCIERGCVGLGNLLMFDSGFLFLYIYFSLSTGVRKRRSRNG